jgi:translocation protein SEC62
MAPHDDDCCGGNHSHGPRAPIAPPPPMTPEVFSPIGMLSLCLHEMEQEEKEFKAVKKMADFLRGRKGMDVRHGVEMGKRIEFFRGDRLGKFLINHPTAAKYTPSPVITKEDALEMGRLLLAHGFIHRSERSEKNKKVLKPVDNHDFVADGYYTWMYDGSMRLRNFLTAALIIGFTGLVCYPIWPQWSKVVVWYMSVTFLIVMVVFSIVRLFLFFILWLVGIEFWILPNIYDDDLGVVDSFKPLYSLRQTDPSERKWRIAGLVAFICFCVWVSQQPTDFDEYLALTKTFTDDLYSGKLLDDMSQKDRDNIDKLKAPSLEELMADENTDMFSEKDEDAIFDAYMEQNNFFDEKEDL